MTAAEVVGFLDGYGRTLRRAGRTPDTTVTSGRAHRRRLRRRRPTRVEWRCQAVVRRDRRVQHARVPALAAAAPPAIEQLTPLQYRNPAELDDGGVLVVGASASGVQIADELPRAGRDVTLAVGEHVRLPRTYRGRDIHWWMDAIGLLDERYDEVDDIAKARRTAVAAARRLTRTAHARPQRTHSPSASSSSDDWSASAVDGASSRARWPTVCADADLKMGRLLDQIDEFARGHERTADRPKRTIVGTRARPSS